MSCSVYISHQWKTDVCRECFQSRSRHSSDAIITGERKYTVITGRKVQFLPQTSVKARVSVCESQNSSTAASPVCKAGMSPPQLPKLSSISSINSLDTPILSHGDVSSRIAELAHKLMNPELPKNDNIQVAGIERDRSTSTSTVKSHVSDLNGSTSTSTTVTSSPNDNYHKLPYNNQPPPPRLLSIPPPPSQPLRGSISVPSTRIDSVLDLEMKKRNSFIDPTALRGATESNGGCTGRSSVSGLKFQLANMRSDTDMVIEDNVDISLIAPDKASFDTLNQLRSSLPPAYRPSLAASPYKSTDTLERGVSDIGLDAHGRSVPESSAIDLLQSPSRFSTVPATRRYTQSCSSSPKAGEGRNRSSTHTHRQDSNSHSDLDTSADPDSVCSAVDNCIFNTPPLPRRPRLSKFVVEGDKVISVPVERL